MCVEQYNQRLVYLSLQYIKSLEWCSPKKEERWTESKHWNMQNLRGAVLTQSWITEVHDVLFMCVVGQQGPDIQIYRVRPSGCGKMNACVWETVWACAGLYCVCLSVCVCVFNPVHTTELQMGMNNKLTSSLWAYRTIESASVSRSTCMLYLWSRCPGNTHTDKKKNVYPECTVSRFG